MTDPRLRLGLLACVGLLAVTLDHATSLGLLALASALPLLAMRPSAAALRRGTLGVLALVWSTVLTQGLFYAEQPRVELIHWGPLTLWREGVRDGLVQSLRFLALSLSGVSLSLSTPPDRLFAAFVALRFPSGLAFLAVTALRFVPTLWAELAAVRASRASRGRPVWARSPLAWLALELSLLRPVVARSLRRARTLAETLDARGFDPAAPRRLRRPLDARPGELLALAAAAGLTLSLASARLLYLLYTSETVYLPALRPLYGFVRAYL